MNGKLNINLQVKIFWRFMPDNYKFLTQSSQPTSVTFTLKALSRCPYPSLLIITCLSRLTDRLIIFISFFHTNPFLQLYRNIWGWKGILVEPYMGTKPITLTEEVQFPPHYTTLPSSNAQCWEPPRSLLCSLLQSRAAQPQLRLKWKPTGWQISRNRVGQPCSKVTMF